MLGEPEGQEVQVNHYDTPTTEGQPGPGAGPAYPEPSLAGAGGERQGEGAQPGGAVDFDAPSAGTGDPGSYPDIDGALGELPSLLARSVSGVQFIYQSLELVAARYGLRDLVVVVQQPDRAQIFRLGRASVRMGQGPLPTYLHAALSGRARPVRRPACGGAADSRLPDQFG